MRKWNFNRRWHCATSPSREAAKEISQLRRNDAGENIRPGGTRERERQIPASLQDAISFYEQPDTSCLANFQLSLRDEARTDSAQSGQDAKAWRGQAATKATPSQIGRASCRE